MRHKKFKHPDQYKPGEIIITEKEIHKRFDQLIKTIQKDHKDKTPLLIIGLLTSAVWITTDIFTRLHKNGITNSDVCFLKVSSYQNGTNATNKPKISIDSSIDFTNKNILLIDDIADTGKTLHTVEKYMLSQGAKSISSFVLLNKPSRREVAYNPTYIGFTIPDIWVQGRGMDTNGLGRGEPNIIKGPYHYTK